MLGATFVGVWAVSSVFSLINVRDGFVRSSSRRSNCSSTRWCARSDTLCLLTPQICSLPLPVVPLLFLPYTFFSLAAGLAAPGASNDWVRRCAAAALTSTVSH